MTGQLLWKGGMKAGGKRQRKARFWRSGFRTVNQGKGKQMQTFNQWLKAVDRRLVGKLGAWHEELGCIHPRRWEAMYEEGTTPDEAVEIVMEEEDLCSRPKLRDTDDCEL